MYIRREPEVERNQRILHKEGNQILKMYILFKASNIKHNNNKNCITPNTD